MSPGTRKTAGPAASGEVLTPAAIAFVNELAERFGEERLEILARRAALQRQFDAGALPDFPDETQALREAEWRVGAIPGTCSTGASRSPGRPSGRWSSTR